MAPYSWLSGNAVFAGQPIQRSVDGLIDTTVRASFNFYGAPAMDLKEFRNYRQDLILGGTLTVIAPSGQYDSSRLVNLGTNRWTVRPELGASQAFGPITMELSAGRRNAEPVPMEREERAATRFSVRAAAQSSPTCRSRESKNSPSRVVVAIAR